MFSTDEPPCSLLLTSEVGMFDQHHHFTECKPGHGDAHTFGQHHADSIRAGFEQATPIRDTAFKALCCH